MIFKDRQMFFLPGAFRFVHQAPENYWMVFGRTYATLAEIPWLEKSLALLCAGMFLAAIATSYQLLGLYERGVIFSAKNVQLLRRIGFFIVGYGVLAILGQTLVLAWGHWMGTTSGPLLNLLAFDFFALLGSPWVLGGICVMVLALIMDEGRKIQEEQELTV